MPSPAVYVISIVGVVAVGFAFKEFIYDPHIAPRLEAWIDEIQERRRRGVEHLRRRVDPIPASVPRSSHEDTDRRSHAGSPLLKDNDSISIHELRDMRHASGRATDPLGVSTSTSRNNQTGNGNILRQRSSAPSATNDITSLPDIPSLRNDRVNSGYLDIPNDNEIPYIPLSPSSTQARMNSSMTFNGAQNVRSPTLSPARSQFSVGSDSVTIESASPHAPSSPLQTRTSIIFDADTDLSRSVSYKPRTHLPTPANSSLNTSLDLSPSPSISLGGVAVNQESDTPQFINNAPASQSLHNLQATADNETQTIPISLTSSHTSILSFNTAYSAPGSPNSGAEFVSLPASPSASSLRSPIEELEEQDISFIRSGTPSSISDLDSLVRSPFSNIDDSDDMGNDLPINSFTLEDDVYTIRHGQREEVLYESLSDSSSEGSWEELAANPVSPGPRVYEF